MFGKGDHVVCLASTLQLMEVTGYNDLLFKCQFTENGLIINREYGHSELSLVNDVEEFLSNGGTQVNGQKPAKYKGDWQ